MKDIFKYKDINFTPVSNRVIVKIPKYITYKQTERVRDDVANKGTDPKEDIQETKLVTVNVKFYYQVAEVVAIPADDKLGLKVGDKVLIDYRAAKKFDLYKDTYWLWAMDVMGVVNE